MGPASRFFDLLPTSLPEPVATNGRAGLARLPVACCAPAAAPGLRLPATTNYYTGTTAKSKDPRAIGLFVVINKSTRRSVRLNKKVGIRDLVFGHL